MTRCRGILGICGLGVAVALWLGGCPAAGGDEPPGDHDHGHGDGNGHAGERVHAADHESHAGERDHAADHEGHDHAADRDADHEGHGHEGHDHGEGSDLDRPLDDLLAVECEHGIPAVDCDECRYEVGAVRVDPQLVDLALVSLAPVERSELTRPIEATATVGFNQLRTVHVSPRVEGVVRALAVDFGQAVREGQTLFTLESQALGEAAGEYLEARAAEVLADQTLTRQQELRSAAVTSERELQEASQAHEAAAIRLSTARDRLLRMGLAAAEVDRLEAGGGGAAVGQLAVRAPLDGTVLELHANPGELVEPGQPAALVGDLSTVWIWADVYEADVAAVSLALADGGVPAAFRSPALPDRVFDGAVDVLGAALDPTTRSIRARIQVDNPDGLLRPGMYGTAALATGGAREALVVPAAAVCSDGERSFVFVRVDGDLFVRRAVHAGGEADGRVEVNGDVEAGQEVVADGSFLLKSEVLKETMGAGCAH